MQRRSKILLTIAIILCLVAGGAFLLYMGVTSAGVMTPRIEQVLRAELQADVRIQGLDFGIISGAHIDQLDITPDTVNNEAQDKAPFVISDLTIRHELLALLSGKYLPEKVRIRSLDVSLGPEETEWLSNLRKTIPKPTAKPHIRVAGGTMRLDFPSLDGPVQVKNFHFSAWSQGDGKELKGLSTFDFGGNGVSMEFEAIPAHSKFETRFKVHGFDFSALPVIGKGKRTLDPANLEAAGTLSGRLSAKAAAGDSGRPNINGELTVSGLSAQYPGVPFRFENGFAKLSVTDNAIAIRDGAINCAQGGIEIPAAGLRFQDHSLTCAWIQANVSGLEVPLIADEQMLTLVPVNLQPEFSSGVANGGVHLRWTPSGGLKYGGDMMLNGVSGVLPKFETDFAGLDASISFSSPGRLVIRQARAQVLGGRGEVAGNCQIDGGGIKNPELELGLKDITEADTLVHLLPGVVREFIGKAGFTNPEVDGLIALEPERTKVDLSINASTAELPDLPIRLDAPRLDVNWASDARQVVFENVHAKAGGSPLEGSGVLSFEHEQPMHLNFSLLGRYLPLNSRLLAWLGLDLSDWQFGGTYDIEMRAKKWWPAGTGASEFLKNMRVQVDLRDGNAAHPKTGQIAENVSGHITLDSEGANLSNMRGDFYGIGLRGSGRFPLGTGERTTYLQVESENINLDTKLYDRLPFDIGLEKLGLSGQCELKAELQKQGSSDSPFSGNITTIMHRVKIKPGQNRGTASGTARLSATAKDWRQPEVKGVINLDDASYGNLDMDRLSADFAYKDRALAIPEMSIGAYGGKIRITDTGINVTDGSWQTTANLAHVELESLVGAYGIEGRKAPSGVMRGDIRLSGRNLDPKTLSGDGTLKISRGRLYSFPLLVSVFNVLDLNLPSRSPVTDAYGDFRIDGGRLSVKDLLFSGGSVPAHLEGSIKLGAEGPLKQKPIDFIVTVAKQEGILDQIPLINWAKHYTLDYLRRLVLQARVEGTFADHEVNTLSSPLTDPIRKMFSLLEKITPAPPGGK